MRDSHDLFDYEAHAEHMKTQQFWCSQTGRVYRVDETVNVASGPDAANKLPDRCDWLCTVRYRDLDDRYIVQPADRNTGRESVKPKRLWLIVKEVPGAKYKLVKGDMVKLGRYMLRVRQLVKEGDPQLPEFSVEENEMTVPPVSEEEAQTVQCRICLLEGTSSDDPLICPCTCKGSIKYVHVDCLRRWVSGQLNISNTDDDIFFYKSTPCELCKTTFPSHVTIGDARLSIARVPTLTPPFILLENVVVGSAPPKGTYVCPMSDRKVLRLGRGHDSEVRIPDVSISRTHATIAFEDGDFYLRDNNSKFGTLVSMKKPFFVDPEYTMCFQAGRTVFDVRLGSPEDRILGQQRPLAAETTSTQADVSRRMDDFIANLLGEADLTQEQRAALLPQLGTHHNLFLQLFQNISSYTQPRPPQPMEGDDDAD